MSIRYRAATPGDVAACVALRGRTRENAISEARLRERGITREGWASDVEAGRLPGYVGVDEGAIAGFCFADAGSGEVVVLAVAPEHEERGVGKRLLSMMSDRLVALGFARIFLGCSPDPKTRSHGFYRHLGWKSTGTFDASGDEVLERIPAKPRVVASIDEPGGNHCVDIFLRGDGSYGFEEYRRDPEDLSGWFPLRRHAGQVFATEALARVEARARIAWLAAAEGST